MTTFALADVAEAHHAIESGTTVGKLVLEMPRAGERRAASVRPEVAAAPGS